MVQEVWKDIEWASNYLINSEGEVKNKQTGRILKINTNRGRSSVSIRSNDGRYVTRAVSNIQAEAFGGLIVPAGRPRGSNSILRTWSVDPEGNRSEVNIDEVRGYRSYRIAGEEV